MEVDIHYRPLYLRTFPFPATRTSYHLKLQRQFDTNIFQLKIRHNYHAASTPASVSKLHPKHVPVCNL